MTWRRTQSSITKYVPDTERSPHPRHLPTSRGPTPLERAEQQARHAEDAPSGSWTYTPRVSPRPVRRILEVQPARATSRTPTRPLGPPPPHMSGPPRTPPAKYRPHSPRDPTPPLLRNPPSQQLRNLENPRLSGGTSGRYWAASAGTLRAYRRPSGQSLWDSWTPRPTCGVCVTTTLPRCPNGVRDH